jgi:LacI family transcriptional regulator
MNMKPRLVDIAKIAEVSPSAVSLALNHKTGISDEVRQKVITIAGNLGYKNASGNPSGKKESKIVRLLKIAKHGHIVNEWHNSFITEYIEGVEMGAQKLNYKLEVAFFNKVLLEDIIETQKEKPADGLIILGTEFNAYELSFFTELSTPIVFIDTYFPILTFDCVDMDNTDGVFKSIQHFYQRGHRNIGLVKSSYETRNFKMREYGFREAMEYFSLPVQEKFIVPVDPAFDQSVCDMNKFLDKNKALPTAFFCMNDIIAYGCMRALRDHGYRIPDDVSIIGFDNLPASSLSDPPLTSIKVSNHQIGLRGLEKLEERIQGSSECRREKMLIAGELVVRNSVIDV